MNSVLGFHHVPSRDETSVARAAKLQQTRPMRPRSGSHPAERMRVNLKHQTPMHTGRERVLKGSHGSAVACNNGCAVAEGISTAEPYTTCHGIPVATSVAAKSLAGNILRPYIDAHARSGTILQASTCVSSAPLGLGLSDAENAAGCCAYAPAAFEPFAHFCG